MGAHLVVKEATVHVAPLVVLFSVHARKVRKSQESVPVDDDNDEDDEL